MVHKLDDGSLNYENIFGSEIGIFGDNCIHKVSECRRKVICRFIKVPHRLKDALEMILVIRLKFCAAHHENRVQLEGVPHQMKVITAKHRVKNTR